jgi:hypothetical protein
MFRSNSACVAGDIFVAHSASCGYKSLGLCEPRRGDRIQQIYLLVFMPPAARANRVTCANTHSFALWAIDIPPASPAD